jgi:hypothetical protein
MVFVMDKRRTKKDHAKSRQGKQEQNSVPNDEKKDSIKTLTYQAQDFVIFSNV